MQHHVLTFEEDIPREIHFYIQKNLLGLEAIIRLRIRSFLHIKSYIEKDNLIGLTLPVDY